MSSIFTRYMCILSNRQSIGISISIVKDCKSGHGQRKEKLAWLDSCDGSRAVGPKTSQARTMNFATHEVCSPAAATMRPFGKSDHNEKHLFSMYTTHKVQKIELLL